MLLKAIQIGAIQTGSIQTGAIQIGKNSFLSVVTIAKHCQNDAYNDVDTF